MGLAEKISQSQAKVIDDQLNRENTAKSLREQIEETRLQAEALADRENTDKKTAFVDELTSLLGVIGAREQLEEVRKVWTVGEIR